MSIPEDPQRTWTAVDELVAGWTHPPDPTLDAVLDASTRAGLPPIQVSACQGRFLHLLARIRAATRVLEIGTLGGYSTICLARALRTGGCVTTIEISESHAAVARSNFLLAGVSQMVDLRVGAALDLLPAIHDEARGSFDLVFIDADKPNNPHYFEWALRMSAPGTVIIVDNVVRNGEVLDSSEEDDRVRGAREVLRSIGRTPGVSSTALQTVGSKGYDGFTITLVG